MPGGGTTELSKKVNDSVRHLAYYMGDAPVLIMVCIEHATPEAAKSSSLTAGSSIYPAVQNLMLAARGLGLGTVLTTLHTVYEKEVKEYFGIPDDVGTVAMIPIGYPGQGERFGRPRRRPGYPSPAYHQGDPKGDAPPRAVSSDPARCRRDGRGGLEEVSVRYFAGELPHQRTVRQ